jgi:hypothetical protein
MSLRSKFVTLILLATPLSLSYADHNMGLHNQVEQLRMLINQIKSDYGKTDQKVYLSKALFRVQGSTELIKMYSNQLINLLNTIEINRDKDIVSYLQWLPVTDGVLPKTALVNAGLAGQNITICRAPYVGGGGQENAVYPGQLTTAGCRISYAGYAFLVTKFDVLAGTNKGLHWISRKEIKKTVNSQKKLMNDSITPQLISAGYLQANLPFNYNITINGATPIAGGYVRGAPVLICRYKQNDAITIGKVVFFSGNVETQDACDIGKDEKEVAIQNEYEILFWKKK